jgi:N6-adenosine-specific RNA methylase IME4
MDIQIQTQDWYKELVDECKAIITEAVFTSRWALVEGYWNLGKRIRDDLNWSKGQQNSLYNSQDLAKSIGLSERTLNYACATYDKYPDIQTLPEGKNITWNKLITKYLPQSKQEEPIPLPDGKYQVIYADPPWPYEEHGVSVSQNYGNVERHYQDMTIEEIKQLPVKDLALENSVLFIWVTSPKLNEVWDIITAWGFEYKTSFVWDKVKHNYGYYNSVRHELLLVCGRGKSTPDNSKLYDSVQTIERSEIHSQKPEEFYKIIEDLYYGPKIELFARNKRQGWEVWGNEVK